MPSATGQLWVVLLVRHCSRMAKVMGLNHSRVICLWFFHRTWEITEYTVLTNISVYEQKPKTKLVVLLHVISVLLAFTSACYELLIDTSKAWMDGVKPVGDSLKLAHQDFILDVPEMNPLVGYTQQSLPLVGADGEWHYWMVFLDSV